MSAELDVIVLGKERFSGKWLRSVTVELSIKILFNHDKNQVVNAWKIANGLTKPNRLKSKKQ